MKSSVPVAVAIALASLVLSITSQPLHAATIIWGAAQNISGVSDVYTVGTLHAAANFGPLATGTNVTVNGVTFSGLGVADDTTTAVSGGNIAVSSALNLRTGNLGTTGNPYAALAAAYKALLNPTMYQTASTPLNFTISGLTVGGTYAIQYWVNDSRSNGSGRGTRIDGAVTLDVNNTDTTGGVGQWVLGQFVADAPTQTFSAAASPGTFAYANAVQIRAVPEPKTFVMALVGGVTLAAWQLRRSRREVAPESSSTSA